MTKGNGLRTHEQRAAPPDSPDAAADGLLPRLPEDRAAVVQYGLVKFQQICSERDQFEREVDALKIEAAARNVELEAMRCRIADAESRIATAMLIRDQAVADRAVYETLFVSIQAQLRTFKVPAVPLVTGSDETEG